MLKILWSIATTASRAPFFKALSQLTELKTRRNRSAGHRRFFFSDSTEKVVEAEAKPESEGSESKSSSAIVSANLWPEDYLTVLALPLPHRPLFRGFYMPIYEKDPKLLAALQESRKRQAPYAGTFLLKDDPKTDASTDTEKSVSDLKGKEFSCRLHEVGSLSQISSIQGDQVALIDHWQLRISEMVSEDPLTIKADHLKDKPYNKDDDVTKATPFEVIPRTKSTTQNSSQLHNSINSNHNHSVSQSWFSSFLLNNMKTQSRTNSTLAKTMHRILKDKSLPSGCVLRENPCGYNVNSIFPRGFRSFSAQAASEPSTSDGLTVDGIVANHWTILDESESDWKSHAAAIAQSIQVIKRRLQWKNLMVRLNLLSAELNKPNLWDDPVHAGKISREHGSLMGKIKEVNTFEQELLEHIDMIKLARDEKDTELESESLEALLTMRRKSKEKELEALLSGELDPCSCYIEVQAGAGGTESMDWASMVMQMYKSWAQRRGYGVTLMDEMRGEMAGIKRATIKVDGDYAFGYAKAEVGVHRLVRISPFDTGKRRHTSFAAVAVIPNTGDGSTHVQINESDLRIERFRAGGAGGQHVNTTESAVRIVHIPTGVTATCQNERSQHQNKASAMAVLQSRLDQLEMSRQAQMNSQHTQSLTEISWGNQIRTYVLHPYQMVKDLRTNYEVSDPDSVLEGDLDGFILSYLSASLDKDEDGQ